jgi:N-acetylated-alpha-linked acidic dipeptidase
MEFDPGNEKVAGVMATEHTPLIQTVEVRPFVRDRYPHHRLRFWCTSVLTTLVLVGGFVAVLLFSFDGQSDSELPGVLDREQSRNVAEAWARRTSLEFDDLQAILLETPDADKAHDWSEYYTSGPHLAGKNLTQALWTKERWQEFGIESTIVDYDVYINYPKGHRLALLEKDSVKFEARLEENVLKEDKASQSADRIPTFHGYSASGNVTGGYVFVNYGTYQDFEDLKAANIDLEGKIALAKYGGVFRGLKVKRAQEFGMIGVVMYSDPGDDGSVTEKNGNKTYPDGPAREPSSVQRGSVQFLSTSIVSSCPNCHANYHKASLLATPPPPAIPVSLAVPVCPSTTRFHRYPLCPYHMRMLCHC